MIALLLGGLFTMNLFVKSGIAEREAVVDGTTYTVRYDYDPWTGMTPAIVGPVATHYTAAITVNDEEGKVVAQFPGVYTDSGCFEDEPKMLVEKALKLKQEEQGTHPGWLTRGDD